MDDGFPRFLYLLPVLFMVIGVGGIAFTLWRIRVERSFARRAASAAGEVTDVRRYRHWHSSDHGGGTETFTFAPVVRFALPDGRTIEAEVYEQRASSPPAGSHVAVRYDADDPTRCRVDGGEGFRRFRHGVQIAAFGVMIGFGWLFLSFLRAFEGS